MENTLRFLITGGTGFIGTYLRSRLLKEGHYLTIITRNPDQYREEQAVNQQFIHWDSDLSGEIAKSDGVINLAGQNLVGVRWTEKLKEAIYKSRIDSTGKLVEAMKKADKKPGLFISASAAGYYGENGDRIVDESFPPGDDYLARVCQDWEAEALKAVDLGIRVAIPRMGIALQDNGGMVGKMKLPFQLFVGGPVGHGKQYIPWVHMEDLCRALLYPVENENLKGPYNANAPNPVTMDELASVMGRIMRRPAFFRVPEFVLKLVLGEGAGPVVTSLRNHPEKLLGKGFKFEFENFEEALADIL